MFHASGRDGIINRVDVHRGQTEESEMNEQELLDEAKDKFMVNDKDHVALSEVVRQHDLPVHELLSKAHHPKMEQYQSASPLVQSITDMVTQGNSELMAIISTHSREAAKAADEARVAMNKLFNAFRNLSNELDKMADK